VRHLSVVWTAAGTPQRIDDNTVIRQPFRLEKSWTAPIPVNVANGYVGVRGTLEEGRPSLAPGTGRSG
jgi:trehalose/maltose hydrolase-like predicted phosphorylase